MSKGDPANFSRLKTEVQQRVAGRLGIRKELKDWSLNDIRDFQNDLEVECKTSVSEKWVYTHFKNESEKLPRIDVLNLLSIYCGYKNWDDFQFSNQKAENAKRNWFVLALMPLLLLISVIGWQLRKKKPFILFVDAYTHESIPKEVLSFSVPGQKPSEKKSIIKLIEKQDSVVVDGAYYKPKLVATNNMAEDTVVIELFPDDYALMLNYFSRSSSNNWQRRREQLMLAIHPEAKIFQSHPQFEGIELLNREEFIDRLILPLNSLKNLDIQDIVYKDEKIYRLRFIQKMNDDE